MQPEQPEMVLPVEEYRFTFPDLYKPSMPISGRNGWYISATNFDAACVKLKANLKRAGNTSISYRYVDAQLWKVDGRRVSENLSAQVQRVDLSNFP